MGHTLTSPQFSILWRRLDQPGHDSARVSEGPDGVLLEGTAVFAESGRPCRLDYRVVCDAQWRTSSARVNGWIDTSAIALDISVDSTRVWTMNGRVIAAVEGCIDVDLNFSPVTNLLPIRRTPLAIGGRIAVRAAWLRLPAETLEPLEQTYERLDEWRYRYESGGGAFVAVLETDAAGLVTRYPGLWEREPAASGPRIGKANPQ